MMKYVLWLSILFMTEINCNKFEIKSLHEILPNHPEIEYIKCHDAQPFHYEPFPISIFPEIQPHEGLFAQTFILKIPNGRVYTSHGWTIVDDSIIEESIAPYWSHATQMDLLQKNPPPQVQKICGRVAVITTIFDNCYAHWIANILSRLALLEMNHIEYDWLYVAHDQPFMKESLALWGIDPAKIITPFGQHVYIQADELIVPSHMGMRAPLPHQYPLNWIPLHVYSNHWNVDPTLIKIAGRITNPAIDTPLLESVPLQNYFLRLTPLCANYFDIQRTEYIKNKFVPLTQSKDYKFSKKVFISRNDAPCRKMINEDEIFTLFEEKGFKRYILSQMSFLEQVALFHEAETIVAAHGSALYNLIFCKRGTNVIEIFQKRSDSSLYYFSQIAHLDYRYIQTTEFENINGNESTDVPINIVQDFIKTL